MSWIPNAWLVLVSGSLIASGAFAQDGPRIGWEESFDDITKWKEAIADIARPESPYKGLQLKPQIGLVPLDRNPGLACGSSGMCRAAKHPNPIPSGRSGSRRRARQSPIPTDG